MQWITVEQYFMDRRELYASALTPTIERNAVVTVAKMNQLLDAAHAAGLTMTKKHPVHGALLSSGWRPPSLNATTPNASPTSLHMTAGAGDVYDPDEKLDLWLMSSMGQIALTTIGLWLEHPVSTIGWSHVQTSPPPSGNRVFRVK